MKNKLKKLATFFRESGKETYASMVFMGVGQILNGQFGKGILYILTEIAFMIYFGTSGITDIIGFFTLGTNKADAWAGTLGDNSVIMLLRGIFAWIAVAALILMYLSNVKDAHKYAEEKRKDKVLPSLKDDISSILDKNFYVTHDQVEAMTMGTRIVVMKDGFVQQIGAPGELYDCPVNTFVAGFIGTPQINFFSGRLTPDGKLKFANDQEITLSAATMDKFDAVKIGSGLDVIMGIRPGDLKLAENKDKPTTVEAKVEVVETLGNETIVYSNLDLEGAETLERTATSITLSAKLKTNPTRHSRIFLDVDEECIHLFDKETEISIRK